jgi:hypothetical protein
MPPRKQAPDRAAIGDQSGPEVLPNTKPALKSIVFPGRGTPMLLINTTMKMSTYP